MTKHQTVMVLASLSTFGKVIVLQFIAVVERMMCVTSAQPGGGAKRDEATSLARSKLRKKITSFKF